MLTMEIFGVKDLKDVRRLCNLSIVLGEKKKTQDGWKCVKSLHLVFYGTAAEDLRAIALPPTAYSCPDTSFCCQLSSAKMFIMPFCKLDPRITFQNKEVLGSILSWDHLADPAV